MTLLDLLLLDDLVHLNALTRHWQDQYKAI